MNRRMGLLMHESASWSAQFTQFSQYSDKLNHNAQELATKLEKERREAKRLSTAIKDSTEKQQEMSKKLAQAEKARVEAAADLERIEQLRTELQNQRDIMFHEMTAIAAAAADTELMDAIANKLELRSDTWSARSFSRNGDALSPTMRSSSSAPRLRTSSTTSRQRRNSALSAQQGSEPEIVEELSEEMEDDVEMEAIAMQRLVSPSPHYTGLGHRSHTQLTPHRRLARL